MNFDFSDDQKLIQKEARKFLADCCPSTEVRKVLDDSDMPYHRELWQQITELGWTGTAIAEEYGGLGLGYLELCVIAEELGRSLAPTPFSSTLYLVAEALKLFGSDEQKSEWLPEIVAGRIIGCLAASEGPGSALEQPLQTLVSTEATGSLKISGCKTAVADGDVADLALFLAADASSGARSLYLADLRGAKIDRQVLTTLDPTRSHAEFRFDDLPVELLGESGMGIEQLQQLYDLAAVLFAFEQVGGCAATLSMGREYCLDRYAFGRQVASFQAIKHRFADMYVATELARANAYYGAWALSVASPELPLAAATARVSAQDAYFECSKENIQVHGGMGYTWELDCHLYYRRAQLLSMTLGPRAYWSEQLASRLLAKSDAEQEVAA